MSYDYSRPAATAKRLLTRFGAAATMRVKSGEKYDPETASMAATWADYPCTVAVLDYSLKDLAGTLVQAGDRRLLVAPDVAQAPQVGSVFVLPDGASVSAVRVSTLAPAGTVVLYDVQARGA